MVCSRFMSCLFLGLLLSMSALGDSIATAHQAMEALDNGRHAIISNKEIDVEAEAATAIRRNWLKGRKMGVEDLGNKKMKSKMNTGKDVHFSSSASIDDKTKENGRNALKLQGNGVDFPRPQQSQIEAQSLVEANDELYKLISKDYHSKGQKRPPINNHLPLEESDDP